MPGSVGVTAVAVPTFEPSGHANGLASNNAARHAFCSVVRREGSCLGSVTNTEAMFAWPAPCVIVVTRLAPLAFDGLPLVDAVKVGVKGSGLQASAWNGLEMLAVAPSVDVSVDSVLSIPQLVGFRM